MSDFFDSELYYTANSMRHPLRAAMRDAIYDLRLRGDERLKQMYRITAPTKRKRVLVVGVEVPARGDALRQITAQLACSLHDITISMVPMQAKGKFENIEDAIAAAPAPLASYDWLVITDDDIALPPQFIDRYLALAEMAELTLSQPAHKFRSHATFAVTRRQYGTLVRRSGFVEIGPLTIIRKDGFADLIPFPPSRWAYGIDVLWSQISRDRGWTIGVVDALPIRHLRPIAASYNRAEAVAEGRRLLANRQVTVNRRDILLCHGELLGGGAKTGEVHELVRSSSIAL